MRPCKPEKLLSFLKESARRPAAAVALACLLLLPGCAGSAAGNGASASQAVSRAVSSSAPGGTSSVSAVPSSAAAVSSSMPGSAASSSAAPRASSQAARSSSGRTAASAPSQAAVSRTVTFSIDGSKGGRGVILPAQKAAYRSGDTVYTVLDRLCGQKKILLSPKGASGSVYVSNIGGLAEFDGGAQSGWLYSVDGRYPNVGCNAYALKAGDTVRWVYTVDNGKTEEARQ